MHKNLNVKCYSHPIHITLFILNFLFGFYSLLIIETFSLYNNQIGTIYGSSIKSRVNCNCDLISSNAKLIVFIIGFFYKKYADKTAAIFKYIYQIYIFLSCFII